MKKGITLALEVYLEGEQDPAADFAALATQTIRSQLDAAFRSQPQGLTLQIRKLQEQDDSDDSNVVLPPPLTPPATSPSVAPSPAVAAPTTSRPTWRARIFPHPASHSAGTPTNPDGNPKPDSPYK
ncbi:MAG: hypothetical protein H0X37_14055 [Herpetosiphonaceae bacterium]|nr:hypothetical protein [Herpetosiphonaceae bacterium]